MHEHFDPASTEHRLRRFVVASLLLGVVVLGVAIFVGLRRRAATEAPSENSSALASWCELRRQWARDDGTLSADILLKSVRPDQRAERERLVGERNEVAERYRRQLVQLLGKLDDPRVLLVEQALVKEGKARANTAVRIANVVSEVEAAAGDGAADAQLRDRLAQLRAAQTTAAETLKQRIVNGRRAADAEVTRALAAIPGCHSVYRGPVTDENTGDSPYVAWDELEMRRDQLASSIAAKVHRLEPAEQFTNQVHHALVRRYRPILSSCFQKQRRKAPRTPTEIDLHIRLQSNGTVKTLGLQGAEVLRDCLLETAGRWRLPAPGRAGESVVIAMDFGGL
ncbi:MAG: hypothetical protein IPL40_01705 [Proteobacteria bacterium]|nr:hypothetical protein [Pseudomonadota bacterium]